MKTIMELNTYDYIESYQAVGRHVSLTVNIQI